MSSVGVFREEEIDGKPFHIFTFLSQTDIQTSSSSSEAPIDSGGNNDFPFQPLFFCPSFRLRVEKLKREENGYSRDEDHVLPFNTSPHFPSIRSSDQQVQCALDSKWDNDKCKLPVVPLFWCNNKKPDDNRYSYWCHACTRLEFDTDYYLCVTCNKMFHKECVESPLEIKHPSYPFLSLQLYTLPKKIGQIRISTCCEVWDDHGMFYHCPTYNLSYHPVCLLKPITIVIDHPKRHPHSLTFFPKQKSLACNVCGLVKEFIPTYVCVRCIFVVHQDCIYFPYVIRICRHQHRISFTSSLPSGKLLSCGVCRKKVDNDCGAYSCNKCDGYFVHPRCALRRDLWDREELEGVPEAPEVVVDPFQTIADGIVLHFSHRHHLKLEISKVYDEDKICQGCVLPIYGGNYYSCMEQCDFVFHEACANAPRKKHHPLHPRSLTLKVVSKKYADKKGRFNCYACRRESCGFVYEEGKGNYTIRLDLRCGLVSEPFEYEGHVHPLFLALDVEEELAALCRICKEKDDGREQCSPKLNCIECDYVICFKCATSPYKARYKHDKHYLTFYEGKEARDHSEWCDVCERRIADSLKKEFYSCDDCCTTLHIDCLLGKDVYMKPGQTIRGSGRMRYIYPSNAPIYSGSKHHIFRNNTLTRPFCHYCEQRCPQKIVFKKKKKVFCSIDCI